ncbi:MAG: bifunctional (p)ppGpp synthetase/guanosine-3',5'-bis(diphosphate) 3'-pyrophosphohydrolase [Alphaproteobacteria bacterium]|nr:bifunctional (p)ppGpp synthetase/guanosine-3',5'-bis(diphosphate) 3'-pyrophosphohydrolase [Alphaproteobacteria bacterium]
MIEDKSALVPVEKLIENIKKYMPSFDEVLLRTAYDYAKEQHATQMRHSGEPYFSHPIAVAEILIEQRLDLDTIITGLLHDVLEDTPVSEEEMEAVFGKSIIFLVKGVTKLAKIKLRSDKVHEAENFRKFIIAAATDLRVLVVKLADRLHNMRTLGFHPVAKKRHRKSIEVMEVYAPLAERIGMNRMKDELELLAFEHIEPDAYMRIQNQLSNIRREGKDLLAPIIQELEDLISQHGVNAVVQGREKTAPSIWLKMQRKGLSFDRIFDIIAFRYITKDVTNCYRILGLIHGKYAMVPGRFKDYISTPKPNGYQSIHTTVVGPKNIQIEIQIRTQDMHDVAEFGVAAHWAYKSSSKMDEKPKLWLSSLVESIQSTEDIDELLEHTKLAGFNDAVFCFSPGGDLIDLPYGATALDFAYAIHSDIGNTCIGAKVNRKIVSISTQLKTGDQVEVLTSKTQEPSQEWLSYVRTSKAKTYIRRYLRQQKYEDMVVLGRQILKLAFEQVNLKFKEKDLIKVLPVISEETLEDVYSQVGEGLRTAESILFLIHPEANKADRKKPIIELDSLDGKEKKQRPVSGTFFSGIAVKFAGCCHPLPGDAVVGVIHTGAGITVHKIGCREAKKWERDHSHKMIEIRWDALMKETDIFFGQIKVMSDYKQGSLNTITQTLATQKMRLHDIHVLSRSSNFIEFLIDVEVKDRHDLQNLINILRTMDDVVSVERV